MKKPKLLIPIFIAIAVIVAAGILSYAYLHDDVDVAVLREKYPYYNEWTGVKEQFASMEESPVMKYTNALIEFEIDGKWIDNHGYTYAIPIKITRVICSKDNFSFDDNEIMLCYPSAVFSGLDAFKAGDRYISFVYDATKFWKTEVGDEDVFGSSSDTTFFVTDDDHVMSLTSDTQADIYSGYRVRDFIKEMKAISKSFDW